MENEESKRFRSFAERYIVERAATFRDGEHELEDAWKCILAAKSIYNMTDQAANAFRKETMQGGAMSGASQQAPQGPLIGTGIQNPPRNIYGVPMNIPPSALRAVAARRAAIKPGGSPPGTTSKIQRAIQSAVAQLYPIKGKAK